MVEKDCPRCGSATFATVMSKFNTEHICPQCWRAEKRHPQYEQASEAEAKAVRRGWRFYPGIGLPPDLIGGGHHLLESQN